MIPHVSINPVQITIKNMWDYYGTVRDSLARGAESAERNVPEGIGFQTLKLFGKNLGDIDRLLEEAGMQASFSIIAAAEAAIRVDFHRRVVKKKPKDSVTRSFRSIYNDQSLGRIRLEDILETWATTIPVAKPEIRTFKEALKFRHWLAHGRYWVPKFGRAFDPTALLTIVTRLFKKIGVPYAD